MAIVQEFISLLTAALGGHATSLATLLTFAGVLLWACGARFSRSIITLVGVGLGTIIGLRLPVALHWPIDGIATAFAGAMLFGFLGWLLQTTFIGFGLSTMLSILFAAATWAILAGDAGWTLPTINWSMPQVSILNTIWSSLPGSTLPQAMPYAVGAGAVMGAGVTLLWPKLARVMTFGLLGTLLTTVMGAVMVHAKLQSWVDMLPQTFGGRLGLFTGFAVMGMAIQWLLLPSAKRAPKVASEQRAEKAPKSPHAGAVSPRVSVAAGGARA